MTTNNAKNIINNKQRECLKILSKLPELVDKIPSEQIKSEFAIFSKLSVLSTIEGLENLNILSELSKHNKRK